MIQSKASRRKVTSPLPLDKIQQWQLKKKDIISTCYVLIMMIESISDLKRAELFGDYVFIYFLTDARYARPFAEQHHLEVQEKLILV